MADLALPPKFTLDLLRHGPRGCVQSADLESLDDDWKDPLSPKGIALCEAQREKGVPDYTDVAGTDRIRTHQTASILSGWPVFVESDDQKKIVTIRHGHVDKLTPMGRAIYGAYDHGKAKGSTCLNNLFEFQGAESWLRELAMHNAPKVLTWLKRSEAEAPHGLYVGHGEFIVMTAAELIFELTGDAGIMDRFLNEFSHIQINQLSGVRLKAETVDQCQNARVYEISWEHIDWGDAYAEAA